MVEDPLNTRLPPGSRFYVVGDVHGHRDKLDTVHARVRADLAARPVARPTLLHLGDLIDRGPDSAGCVDRLAGGSPVAGAACVTLMGNHEQLMLRALAAERWEDVEVWLDNGGDRALASWGVKSTGTPEEWERGIPPAHLAFIRGLPASHRAGAYLFVHAGVRPGVPLDQQRPKDLMWIRDVFLHHHGPLLPDAPGTVVVHGHTPAPAPDIRRHQIGLDTGAGKGGLLTCAILEGDAVETFQA